MAQKNRALFYGIIAGLTFGILDIIPMFFMKMENMVAAVSGAFINRFTIGVLIFTVRLPVKGWLKGLIIGLVLSLPDAIITDAWVPILGLGILGGLVIGIAEQKINHNLNTGR